MSSASKSDIFSRVSNPIHGRRNTNDGQAERQEKKANDQLSVITQERLKKFNEIHGTVAGNAYDEIEAAEFVAKDEQKEPDEDPEEVRDTVAALQKQEVGRTASADRADAKSVT